MITSASLLVEQNPAYVPTPVFFTKKHRIMSIPRVNY